MPYPTISSHPLSSSSFQQRESAAQILFLVGGDSRLAMVQLTISGHCLCLDCGPFGLLSASYCLHSTVNCFPPHVLTLINQLSSPFFFSAISKRLKYYWEMTRNNILCANFIKFRPYSLPLLNNHFQQLCKYLIHNKQEQRNRSVWKSRQLGNARA